MPSVFTLGKEPFALGKRFAECSTRQNPLGKIFLGKGSLPNAFYWCTRQNKKQFCRVLGAALGKIFSAVAAPTVNGYFAECPTPALSNFFLNHFAECPSPGTRQSFFLFFLKNYFAECPFPGTRQSFLFFLNNFFAECPCLDTRQRIFEFFLKKILCRVPRRGTRQRKFIFFFKNLCRVPCPWHSAKTPRIANFFYIPL